MLFLLLLNKQINTIKSKSNPRMREFATSQTYKNTHTKKI